MDFPVSSVVYFVEYSERTNNRGQSTNFITCGRELSAPLLSFTGSGGNSRRIIDRFVWVVRSDGL